MTIDDIVQEPSTDDRVELFILDATAIGGALYRFVSGLDDGSEVVWDGDTYSPVPVEASGFEWSGQGQLPRPKMKVANASGVFGAAAIASDDLLGATVKRIRTFWQFLDNGSNPDPDAIFPIDIYTVNRKVAHNKVYIEWELAPALDQEGLFLPRRQVLQGHCSHRYRRWDSDSEAFDYSAATCPYTGTDYFRADGTATADPSQDQCSKKLTGCQARFGNDPLPTRQFPGVARVRQ